MPDEKVAVTAVFQIAPGGEDEFVEAAQRVVPPTRAEPGCIEYRLHRHLARPGSFALYEGWRSQADLDRHLATPHIAAFLAQIEPVLAGEVAVELWREIA